MIKKLLHYLGTSQGKIFSDCIVNIIASLLVTAVLQIIVYPYMAQQYGGEKYGLILTVMAVFNIFNSSFGNTLNNTRLLQNNKYNNKGISGDFNILISIISILGSVGIFIVVCFFYPGVKDNVVVLAMAALIGIARAYYIVSFRLELNFKKHLISNLILAIGYGVGMIVAHTTGAWAFVFLGGELCSFLYILKTTSLPYESWRRTALYQKTKTLYLQLTFTSLIGNVLIYLDRLLINPLLGSISVSLYTIAAFWGKSLSSFLEPIANVLLGYFSKGNLKLTISNYFKLCVGSCVLILCFWGAGCFISPYLIRFLYPDLARQAIPYIPIVSIATLLPSVITFVRPAVLVISNKKKLLGLQIFYTIVYLVAGIVFSKLYGLKGFAFAVIVANFVYLLGFIGIGLQGIARGGEDV